MFYSPLRYPGGKNKIAKFIKLVFEKNLLHDGYYVEPYAGGASVGLFLLMNEHASKIIINDFDRSIYAFWYSVLNETEQLCALIMETPINRRNWKKQKKIQKNKNNAPLLQLGFSTFFLNRTNRSVIIKGGIIGGQKQSGAYRMNARFNKIDLIERIKKIAAYKERISLYNLDACQLLIEIENQLPAETLIYFDPPYYVKGKGLYVNHYKHEDHVHVANMVNGLRNYKWIVSYDSKLAIKKLYRQNWQLTYSLRYSARNHNKGKEIMMFSDGLFVPTLNPTKVA